MEDKMKIIMCFILDPGYVVQTIVAMTSLKLNKKDSSHYICYLLCSKISLSDKRKIERLASAFFDIIFIDVVNSNFSSIDDSDNKYLAATNTALFKFEIPNILKDIEKVIYIDGDVLIKKDLVDLFNIELDNDTYVAACPDLPQILYKEPIFNTGNGKKYFNSGVMLMNLKKMRVENTSKILYQTKLDNRNDRLMDQNILNIVFDKNVKTISPVFNLTYLNLKRSASKYSLADLNDLFGTDYTSLEEILNDAYVIHFSSKDKPWTFFDVPCADKWLYYLNQSPCSNIKLIRHSINDRKNTNFKKMEIEQSAQDCIPIVLCCDRKYLPNLCVTIRSVIENHKKNKSLRIYVLYTGIEDVDITRVTGMKRYGCDINFIDITNLVNLNSSLYSVAHYSLDMYNRWYIPEILFQYTKLLYLDSDMIVRGDVKDLYDIPLNDNVIGACINLQFNNKAFYREKRFGIDKNHYVNSGMLLINIKEFVKGNYKEKLIDYVAKSDKLDCPDQDALNVICQGKIKIIENRWNYQWHYSFLASSSKSKTAFDLNKYTSNYCKASIIHYTSQYKPWNCIVSNHAFKLFWQYAVMTPLLDELVMCVLPTYDTGKNLFIDRKLLVEDSNCSLVLGLIISAELLSGNKKQILYFLKNKNSLGLLARFYNFINKKK